MQLKKALLKVMSVLVFVLVLFPVVANAEELQPGQCEMTIESDKHTPQNPAQATGPCNGLMTGYYLDAFDRFDISGPVTYWGIEKSGQQFTVGTPKHPYGESILTVYIVRKEPPKQEEPKEEKPKEEPKEESPKKEQPSQPPKQEEPKQEETIEEKPKQENTGTDQNSPSKPTNKSNTNNQTQTENKSENEVKNGESAKGETDLDEPVEEVDEENDKLPTVGQVNLTNFEPIIDDYNKSEGKISEDVKSADQDTNQENPLNSVSTDNRNTPKLFLGFLVGIAVISFVTYGIYKRKG